MKARMTSARVSSGIGGTASRPLRATIAPSGGLVQRLGWGSPKPQVGVRFPGPPLDRRRHLRPRRRPARFRGGVAGRQARRGRRLGGRGGGRGPAGGAGGGVWKDEASRAMLGMSAPEWSVYMRDELRGEREPRAIDGEVVRRL